MQKNYKKNRKNNRKNVGTWDNYLSYVGRIPRQDPRAGLEQMGDAMKNKTVYRVRAKSLDSQGRGVVSFNHSMIPVPGLLPGELAQIVLYRKGDETLGRTCLLLKSPGSGRRPSVPGLKSAEAVSFGL